MNENEILLFYEHRRVTIETITNSWYNGDENKEDETRKERSCRSVAEELQTSKRSS